MSDSNCNEYNGKKNECDRKPKCKWRNRTNKCIKRIITFQGQGKKRKIRKRKRSKRKRNSSIKRSKRSKRSK